MVFVVLYRFKDDKNQPTDLLHTLDWSHFIGATITPNGIHFQPKNGIITHQDGSAGQPNPPVNLSGQHLKVKGDFMITTTFSDIDKEASFRLYAEPPIVYDQWRYEPPSLELAVTQNLITLRIWDGTSSNSIDMRAYPVSLSSKTTISLERKKDQIHLTENGRALGSIPDHAIFKSGTVWLGADSPAGSAGWTLAALHIHALGSGRVEIVPAPSIVVDLNDHNSLRRLADAHPRKLKIGAAVAIGPLLTDERYKELALGQFSMLTPENSMKPQFIHPQPDVYAFEEADQLVEIALKNTMVVHGHALVYDKSNPDWMRETPTLKRQKIMIDHIERVVSHFQGRVAEWDVVNEPFSKKRAPYTDGKQGLEPNIWFEAMGEEYIDLAFKAARKADPSAKLYLNDYGLENDGEHWDSLLRLVKRLKARNVPIDGVGFEAHVYGDGDYMHADQLKNHMESLAKLGLLTRISEIDVTQDNAREQTHQYEMALDICLRAPNCTSYTTWGITDTYGSTTRSDRYPLVYGTSLLWDKDMKAKPAFSALQQKLRQ